MTPSRAASRANTQPSQRGSRWRARSWWAAAAIVLAGVLTYANSLGNPFLFDDNSAILQNPSIRSASTALAPPAETPVAGRPLVNASFALNYALGGTEAWGYRAVNLGLHVACGLVILLLVRRHLPEALALPVALLWTVHPLNSEVVNYVTQRTESMMALCCLVTLYAAGAEGRSRARGQVVAVVACAAGMACKETMAVAPVAVLLYDSALVYGSVGEAWRTRRRFYLALAATWLLLAALVATHGQSFAAGFASARASVWTYLLNQSVMIAHYFRLAVWPQGLVVNYGWARGVTLADVWPYFALVSTALAATIVTLVRRPRIGVLAAWVFLTLGPTSSLIPIATEVGAERRMYLPLVGILTLAVLGVRWLWERAGLATRLRWLPAAALVALTAAGSLASVARNREYRSALTMSETIVARWPSPNAHQALGVQLAAAGRYAEALPHLREAAPGFPFARYFLGEVLLRTDEPVAAIEELRQFIRDEPGNTRNARLLLAQAYAAANRPADAIDELRAVVAANPDEAAAHALLADMLVDRQAFAEAIPHYEAFLRASPRNTNGWTGLGVALVAAGQGPKAIAAFRSATGIDPRNGRLRQNLARALLDHGDPAEALAEAQEAVTLGATDPASFEVLGRVLAKLGRVADARLSFQRALQLDPAFGPALDGLRMIGR